MKKLLFILLWLPMLVFGQAEFDEGVKITGGQPTVTSSVHITTTEADGTQGKILGENISLSVIPPTTHYIPTTPNLQGHFKGIDDALGDITQTTAGVITRVWWTADATTITAGTFYLTNPLGKGTAASAIQNVVNGDNVKTYFAQDLIGQPFANPTVFPTGTYSGNLSASTSPNSAQQRYSVELYRCNNNGTPIASGVSGAPVGSLGVTVIVLLDSGLLTLPDNEVVNVPVNGTLGGAFNISAGERIRYHVAAEKVGTAGGNITQTVHYGTNYNSYLDVPVTFNTSSIVNISNVTGATATEALNTLNVRGMQPSYLNSTIPQVTVNDTQGAMTLRNGRALNTSTITEWQNIAGITTASVNGNGLFTSVVDSSINGLTLGKGTGSISTNTTLGFEGLLLNVSGTNNTALGYRALRSSVGNSNTGIGSNSLWKATGSNNTSVGASSLLNCVACASNTSVGEGALQTLASGSNNTFVGVSAGSMITGNSNSGLGNGALQNASSGTFNVSMGYLSLSGVTTTSNNTGIGKEAGRFLSDGTTNSSTPTNSVFIGSETKSFALAQSNETVIGYNAIGIGSNSAVLGNDSVTKTALKGRVIQGQTGTIVDNGVDAMQTTGSTTQTGQFKSTLATGTAPFSVASTTLNTNLNADLLDGLNSTAFALLASPALTGTPTSPTATVGTNTTQIATTAFVQANGRPYKSYVIEMTQYTTSDPVANIVFENTIGSITLTRSGVGTYMVNGTGLFTGDKTFITISNNKYFSSSPVFLVGNRISIDQLELNSYVGTTLTDNVFGQTHIEIRVYN